MYLRKYVPRAAVLAALAAAQCTSPQKDSEETQALRRRVAELEARLEARSVPAPTALATPQSTPTPIAKRAAVGPRGARTNGTALPDDDMTQMLLDDPSLGSPPPLDHQPGTAPAEHWSIPDGAKIELVLETGLSSRTSAVGDPLVARVERVADSDGPLPLPSGSVIEGRVTRVRCASRTAGKPLLSVVFDRINVRGRRQALEPIAATLESQGVAGAAPATKPEELDLRPGDRWTVTVARIQRGQRD